MIKSLVLMTSLALLGGLPMSAQSCKVLYQEGNTLVDQGKLEKAKSKFQQVIHCGNNLYVPDSEKRIAWIDRVLRKPSTAKPFSLSDNKVVIPYQGGQDVITVDGNGSWTAFVNDKSVGWCKIKKEKGKIYIVSEANENNTDRSCEVVVRMGGKTRTVVVKNEKAPEMLVPSVENLTFPYKGETNTVEIRSNTNWKVTDVPGWVVSTKENGKIKLTALANDHNVERSAEIKVESSTKTVIINLYQGAGLDHLAFSKNDLHFGPDGGDEYVQILTDAQDWRFGDFPHWCQVTKVADNLLKIHCTPNEPINLNREASVNVTTGKQTLGINVCQEAKPLVAVIPNFGIGGRAISFGISAGYLFPNIINSSGGDFTGSVVNYALGDNRENASYKSSGGFNIGLSADIRIYKNFYLKPGVEFTHYKYKNYFSGDVEIFTLGDTKNYYFKGNAQNQYQESYTFNEIEIPVIASYRIPVTKISHLQINIGPSIRYGLSAKMKISGNTDANKMGSYKIVNNQRTDIVYSQGLTTSLNYSGSGELNLYKSRMKYSETYSDEFLTNGVIPKDCNLEDSPLKKLNFGARLGVSYEYAGISFGMEYNIMLSNAANEKYWNSERWRIFDKGADVLMSGYKQRNNYFSVKIGYTFRY